MPETPEARRKRLAERQRVDAHFKQRQLKADAAALAKAKKPAPKPTAKQQRNAAAKKRRDTAVKKTAPSGYQRLLKALGWK